MRQIITPNNQEHWLELRQPNINSTEISALFGISPYCTPYELWYRKKEKYEVEFTGNQRTRWGIVLQDSIANEVAKEKGWLIRRMDEYIFDDQLRIGASYDFAIGEDGIIEVKNVDYLQFKKEWIEKQKGEYEGPLWIEIQVQQELMVSGRLYCWIAVLVGGNDLKLIKRTADPKVQEAIILKAAEFWKTIDANTPPKPDFDTDADFISKLCGYAEPGKVVDLSNDGQILALALEYLTLKESTKVNDKRCDSIKAEILVRIGDAEKGIAPTFSISAGVTGPTWVEAYERKGFRRFLISPKKEK